MSFLAAKHVGSISMPQQQELKQEDQYVPLDKPQLEYNNLTSMSRLHELNVVENLNHRYLKRPPQIYTAINNILLAVNPYQDVGVYGPKDIKKHSKGETNDPHIFSVTNRAYRQLIREEMNQSILVCGESGSGKTETAKYAMRFLTSIGPKGKASGKSKKSQAKDLIEQQIIAVNPVLESFGNAKTTMNNNSSRFAKFTQILFSKFEDDPKAKTIAQKVRTRAENTKIVGSAIQTYLLEKPRVVRQAANEKNFHVFYQIFNMPKAKLQEFGLTQIKDFKYLGDQGETKWVEGQQNMYTKKTFDETCKSMEMLGFSDKERDEIFRCVAGVLHLGNVSFADSEKFDRDQECELQESDKHHVKFAAKLFGVDEGELVHRLTTYIFRVGGEHQRVPYKIPAARDNRDSIARNIYEGVFNDLVKRLNVTLHKQDEGEYQEEQADRAGGQPFIGVLDVFGFENFEVNSFEQFSINFANETLQQLFDKTVIGDERIQYIKEGVFWGSEEDDGMDKGNSEICLVLLSKIYHSLDEQCRMDRTPENFVNEIHSTIAAALDDTTWMCLASAPPRKMKGLLTPNGALSPRASGGMLSPRAASPRSPAGRGGRHRRTGSNAGLKETFRIQHYAGEVAYTATQFLIKNKDRVVLENAQLFGTSNSDLVQCLFEKQAQEEPQGRKKASKQKGIGGVFRDQMKSLMLTLGVTGCHFVRCLNPNNLKKKGKFDDDYIAGQLRAGGIVAALEVMKKGYPTRKEFQAIKDIFANCKPLAKQHQTMNARDFTQFLLIVFKEQVPEACYKLGNTKLFFKPGQADKLDLLSESTESISSKQVSAAESWFKGQRLVKLRGFAKASAKIIRVLRYNRMRAKVQPLCHAIIFMGSLAVAQKRRYEAAETIKVWYRTRQEEQNFNAFMDFCAQQLPAGDSDFKSLSQDDKIDVLADASAAKWGIQEEEEEEEEEPSEQEEEEEEEEEAEERVSKDSRESRYDEADGGDSDRDIATKRPADYPETGITSNKRSGDSIRERRKKAKAGLKTFFSRKTDSGESDADSPRDSDRDSSDEDDADIENNHAKNNRASSSSSSVMPGLPQEAVEDILLTLEKMEQQHTEMMQRNNELMHGQLRLAEEVVQLRKGADPSSSLDELDEHVRRLTEMASGIETNFADYSAPLKAPKRSMADRMQFFLMFLLVVQILLILINQVFPNAHNPRAALAEAAHRFAPYYNHVVKKYLQ